MATFQLFVKFVLVFFLFSFCSAEDCKKVAGADLTDACIFKGLLIRSPGGTVVNETNCNVLLPKQVFGKQPKEVTMLAAKSDSQYTIVAIDPDAPNHTAGKFWLHWIRSNVPGSSLAAGKVDGKDVKSFVPPGPPEHTNDHRYMFLVYEQTTASQKMAEPELRPRFDIEQWLKGQEKGGKLCGPVAGVQFRSAF